MIGSEIVYGVHAVEEFIYSYPERVNKVLLASNRPKLEKSLKVLGIPFQRVPVSKIENICGKVNHQGIIALVSPLSYHHLKDILLEEKIVLALDGIEDPQNLGAILRTAEAAGVNSVIIPTRRSAPVTSTVIKVSSGAAIRLKIIRTNSMVSAIRYLKDRGFWIIGSDVEGSIRYDEADYPFPSLLILGREGKGMHKSIKNLCDMKVYIPMYGKVQSLNVSVACGIILYEMLRKLRSKPI
ncbi:MAG: 23S rRNA (guanosine(2251)-2'-O)-methyltransferase RlmB [Synergistetes bacterium]|nr:23S rRNA (guanosine(2251)-2'-O)-methyltransferase RlmB [Synergistota bacterium]MDW8193096.1 23S rRNA (guanosine(2251)-2'-O)-methyltransferase RlmB [Synergistota bacterium]